MSTKHKFSSSPISKECDFAFKMFMDHVKVMVNRLIPLIQLGIELLFNEIGFEN